jgi:hypothetical protein
MRFARPIGYGGLDIARFTSAPSRTGSRHTRCPAPDGRRQRYRHGDVAHLSVNTATAVPDAACRCSVRGAIRCMPPTAGWAPTTAQPWGRPSSSRRPEAMLPTRDLLNDYGMMGDGIIELRKIRAWVEDAGLRERPKSKSFPLAGARPRQARSSTSVRRYRTVV